MKLATPKTLPRANLGQDDRRHQVAQEPGAVSLNRLHERLLEEQRHKLIPSETKVQQHKSNRVSSSLINKRLDRDDALTPYREAQIRASSLLEAFLARYKTNLFVHTSL